ncbi:cora-like Mg2+ transporter domain-containing protein, related [Neospora caninum Liverpool]|uniref:Cora-like Mg2+ transporter domain-containing protein, related n=1 Tax=Neospora caninum (strain Liverpool) TaxID=572307 RepID=F0V7C4_NEOCL|nr:cora-like Mg2+ transporter domain-containing protein, related [Neospora caninum Liverpool]CBZ49615.1 cora-like Mg2+ transporter domain-containing protein, related [Neospora caninum Liverpool]|eukprot:XP_003879650.1 cora-like Mg2+ transporter domain-containing protein, related [Neospora caninum Liverpool]
MARCPGSIAEEKKAEKEGPISGAAAKREAGTRENAGDKSSARLASLDSDRKSTRENDAKETGGNVSEQQSRPGRADGLDRRVSFSAFAGGETNSPEEPPVETPARPDGKTGSSALYSAASQTPPSSSRFSSTSRLSSTSSLASPSPFLPASASLSSLSSLPSSVYDGSPFAPPSRDVTRHRRNGDASRLSSSPVAPCRGLADASGRAHAPSSPSSLSSPKIAPSDAMADAPCVPYKVYPAEHSPAGAWSVPSEGTRLDVPLLVSAPVSSVSGPRTSYSCSHQSQRPASWFCGWDSGASGRGEGGEEPSAAASAFQTPKSRSTPGQTASRARRLQVLEIARGTCHRHLLQTSELLRCAAQRPSIELRRNCVLVNLPYVKCLILCGRILLLPSDTESANHLPQFFLHSHASPQFFSFSRVFSQTQLGSASPVSSLPVSSLPSSSMPSSSSPAAARPPAVVPKKTTSSSFVEDGAAASNARSRARGPGAQGSTTAVGGEATPSGETGPGRAHAPLLAENEGPAGRHREEKGKRKGRSLWRGKLWWKEARNPWVEGAASRGEAAEEDSSGEESEEQTSRDRRREWTEDSHACTHKLEDEEAALEVCTSGPVSGGEGPNEDCFGFFWGDEKDENEQKLLSKLVGLSASAGDPGDGPFEFAALEAILVHRSTRGDFDLTCAAKQRDAPFQVCDALKGELEPIALASTNLLRFIHEQPSSTRKLRKVGDLRRRLGCVRDKVRGIDQALRELLDSEDDLRRLQVSRFWHHEKEWERPSRNAQAEEVEILLECYEQEIDALLQSIIRRDEALDDALQLMELHLASIRNAFLKSELALDIIGVLFAGIAAFAGVFGMNIRSGWEEDQRTFWVISLVVSALSVVTVVLVYIWFKRQKL